jgi:hypothetical protein
MRKAEIRINADKITLRERNCFLVYKALAYRWEENRTADPEIKDEKFFLTEEEAIKYADELTLDVGFNAQVDTLTVPFYWFNEEIKFREEFNLSELDDCNRFQTDIETTYHGKYNEGNDLEGVILVSWSYEKYAGYARNFNGIRYANKGETDSSISTGNEERTFWNNESVLLSKQEIEDLSDTDILDLVNNELGSGRWKWNYFKNNPTDEKIIYGLNLTIED